MNAAKRAEVDKQQAAQVLAAHGHWMCDQAVEDLWPWIQHFADAAVAEAVRTKDDAMTQVTDERDEMARLNEGLRLRVAEAVKELKEENTWLLNDADYQARARVAEARREERGVLAESLAVAWQRYQGLFEDVPHGTVKQMAALLELLPPASAPEGTK